MWFGGGGGGLLFVVCGVVVVVAVAIWQCAYNLQDEFETLSTHVVAEKLKPPRKIEKTVRT